MNQYRKRYNELRSAIRLAERNGERERYDHLQRNLHMLEIHRASVPYVMSSSSFNDSRSYELVAVDTPIPSYLASIYSR